LSGPPEATQGPEVGSLATVLFVKNFLAVESPQVKGVLLTIPPSSFMAARLLLRDAGVKVERPERSEDERP
jgi:hypothetical protein